MEFELRDYQVDLLKKAESIIRQYGFVYLSWEVKTGKTIGALYLASKSQKIKSVLFVTTKKNIPSIYEDYELGGFEYNLEVINYASLHKIRGEFQCVIIDEAHKIGAFPKPSNRTKTLREICKKKAVIYLSGTPTPESYSQLFHQFWVCSFTPWSHYKNFYEWVRAGYVTVKEKYFGARPSKDYSEANAKRIKAETDRYFVSLTQQEAGYKQLIEEEILSVEMDESTIEMIKAMERDRVIEDTAWGIPLVADTGASLMQKLHQIGSGTVAITIEEEGQKPKREYRMFDRSKAWFIKDHFKDQKIAIFYKFVGEGNMLRQTFPNHTDIPEEFEEDPTKTFIGQFQSCREGIRLYSADALVMFNIDFSAVSYWQTRGRLIYKERTKPAKLYWIFGNAGIEREIYSVVVKKQDYNITYYRNVRKQIAKEDNRQTKDTRVLDFKNNINESERGTRPNSIQGRQGSLFGD